MNIKDFRKNAHELVDWMADYLEGDVRDYPVKPDVAPGSIKSQLPASAPQKAEDFNAIFDDFKTIAMPGITHWQHPRFFAYFPSNSSAPSVLAEMLTATLGVNAMMWETSPAATEIEEHVMGWLRDMFGLPSAWDGVIQDTASTATLCAILTARERATVWLGNAEGLREQPQLCFYASAESHSSVQKALRIAGLGDASLRLVPLDAVHAMDAEALEGMVKDDILAGKKPAAIIATLGTTSVGAFDPIESIGKLARTHDVYLHVDAAWAGSAFICPEYQDYLQGIEQADSIVINAHKWLMTNFDCTLHFVKDAYDLQRTFAILPEYLKTKNAGAVTDYRDWGIQLGRRFRALKLWFVVRAYGVEGLQTIIRNHIDWAADLAVEIASDDRFEIITGPNLSLITFRLKAGDEATERLLQKVNDAGFCYLTRTVIHGQGAIRFQIGQTETTRKDVMDSWNHICAMVTI